MPTPLPKNAKSVRRPQFSGGQSLPLPQLITLASTTWSRSASFPIHGGVDTGGGTPHPDEFLEKGWVWAGFLWSWQTGNYAVVPWLPCSHCRSLPRGGAQEDSSRPEESGGCLSQEPGLVCPVPRGPPRPGSLEAPPVAFLLLLLNPRLGHLAAWTHMWVITSFSDKRSSSIG